MSSSIDLILRGRDNDDDDDDTSYGECEADENLREMKVRGDDGGDR